MSQTTLGDDDLFDEAALEMREEVEEHLAATRAALPDPEAVWETDADNVLGVLNGLKTALNAADAVEHLRQAKKQFVMGERADAFDDAEDLEEEIAELEELVTMLQESADEVGSLASTIPQLRSELQDASDADEDEDEDEDE
jgi:HAMP domain-containing protein